MWRDDQVPAGIKLDRVYIGADPDGLGGFQIAVAQSDTQPKRETLTGLFNRRRGRKQISLIVVVTHNGIAYLCGPDPQSATLSMPVARAERYLQSVLDEPDDLAARQRFASFQKALDTTNISGFTNSGLFASHHIRQNVPKRDDWSVLAEQAAPMLKQRGQRLIDALGFRSKTGVGNTLLLSADTDAPRAIAVLLDESEQFDAKSPRFQLTPVAFGLNIAARHDVPWLLVLRKDQIRLYPGKDGIGVGQKGQTETFFEVDLSTIDDEYAALLPLVFSAAALQKNGTATELLDESNRYATALGTRLRERIYDDVVPPLAQHVASQLPQLGVAVDAEGLATAYRLTLRILFRLLFQAYAEDRQLLPADRNEHYRAKSLKTVAQRDMNVGSEEFSGESTSIWSDLNQVWEAIDQGYELWNVPAYNGGLFASDPERNREGALIAKLRIPDAVLGPALQSLLVDITEDGVPGPVDFRSLSVREFGTIYEGLLESSLSLADADLAINEDNIWVPAREGDEVIAPSGSVYFHSASGERKATGSYFTPKVVVDHLIERSITPALSKHLNKIAGYLREGDEARAAREFFDFRVADLAMGSGHFLVAAVDKIEAMMRSFLTEHQVPGVRDELIRLAGVAKRALGDDQVAIAEVDEISLLRRQIARRCIYGLDINQLAVELARLALWIDTFVPGLPMSNLDHGLVCGNTLTGIGTVEEAVNALIPREKTKKKAKPDHRADHSLDLDVDETDAPMESGYQRMVRRAIVDHLATTLPLLEDVASASESTKAELQQSAKLLDEVQQAATPARRLFDAAIATRMGRWQPKMTRPEHVARLSETTEPSQIVAQINPAHMPVLFPEVFVRENPGFDVLIGNPPWEELKVEERSFWLQYRPGLYGLSDAERVAEINRLRTERSDLIPLLESKKREVQDYLVALRTGPFPGIGTGDPELAKAFAWRNWALTRKGGFLGIVLPRTLLNTAGGELWRKEVLRESTTDAQVLINTKRWVFDIHPQYAIALIAIEKIREVES